MNEPRRETFGAIWRLCEQMAYSAENGREELLKAQYSTLSKYIARLDMLKKLKEA